MHKKSFFTLIELLVVITIIALLASMLFPMFQKMRQKAERSNSIASLKDHTNNIIGHFTDARNQRLPNLITAGIYSQDHFNEDLDIRENTWQTRAGEIGFGYPTYFWESGQAITDLPLDSIHQYSIWDTEIRALNGLDDSQVGALKSSSTGRGFKPSTSTAIPMWIEVNHSESAIMTSYTVWADTHSMKPVSFGDGHVVVSGEE